MKRTNEVDEAYIIKQLKAGDNSAYRYLYERHYEVLCRFSYYVLRDKVSAEEVVNDVIFHLWEVREHLELTPPLRNYLIVAVRNRCLNYLASKRRECEIHFSAAERYGLDLQDIVSDDLIPSGVLLKKELQDRIQSAIDDLPIMCRKVFMMSRFGEMTYEEIAQASGISVNTVKYHIKYALSQLRKELKDFLCIFLLAYTTLFCA